MTGPLAGSALMLLFLVGVLAAVAAVELDRQSLWRMALDGRRSAHTGFSATTRNEAGERVRPPTGSARSDRRRSRGQLSRRGRACTSSRAREDGVFNASMSGASLDRDRGHPPAGHRQPRPEARDLGRGLLCVRREVRGLPPARNTHAPRRRRVAGDGLRISETLLSMRALEDSRRVLQRATRRTQEGAASRPRCRGRRR